MVIAYNQLKGRVASRQAELAARQTAPTFAASHLGRAIWFLGIVMVQAIRRCGLVLCALSLM